MITERIKSIRESVGKEYTKPPPEKLEKFQDILLSNPRAQEYLQNRGLSQDTISYFSLGYDPDKDAIAIPVFRKGELINIKYRLLEPKDAKYLGEANAENYIYHDRGLENSDTVLIVEGEFDAMAAWQMGFKNVVSPASGKDSYGAWIALLENKKKIYIAYDNDEGGKDAASKLAERIGIEKCFEVLYPQKDANELLANGGDINELVSEAKPYVQYQFKGVGELIKSLRNHKREVTVVNAIPDVEIEKDWLIVISGKTNVGKTSYTLNIADELASMGKPTLIMPFERGIESVGKRFLQVKFDKSADEFAFLSDIEWDKLIERAIDTPVYFACPKLGEIEKTIVNAKKYFGIEFVIIDHLDYIVRNVQGNREAEIANTLQSLKRVAEANKVVVMIVTHVRKVDQAGATIQREPNIEDLKGSSSLYQDPECVVLVHSRMEGHVTVKVAKNKGKMSSKDYGFNATTGRLSDADDF
jgi:KaiC/GvpD/RAD55 family RecA-like ATPase/5S rRNA maturation endonuclease (ribonuclease M5)